MPIRGENVGTAYVRILADGSGLSDSVRDDLQKGEADFARAGDDDAKAFGDSYSKRLKKDRPTLQKDIEKTFTLEGERIKRLTDEMGSNFYKNMEKSILRRTSNGKVGEKILAQIRKDFVKGGGYDAFGKGFEDLFRRLPDLEEAALREMARDEQRHAKESASLQRQREHEFEASVDRAVKAFERISRGEANSGEKIRASIRKTIGHIRELNTELEKRPHLGGDGRDDIRHTLDSIEAGLARISPRLRRFNGTLDRTSIGIGKAFGKGSRNDFINFFGSSIQGISSLIFKVPKLAEGVLGVVGSFKELRQTEGILKSLTGAFGGAAKGGSSFASSLAAGAVAIPIVVAVVGTLVAAVSLLLGTLTALASTISFAVVGALGVLAGAMAPVAAGIAVVVAGIASMSDAQKKALSQAIKPFTKEMKALGQIASKELFRDAPEMASRLGSIFKGLRPAVKGIAVAIREVADSWLDALEGPGFKRFKDQMGKVLPGLVKDLGQSFGNVVGGLGGLFVGLLPATREFVHWLEDITAQFAEWANSLKGQNQIHKFMRDALESAQSLGRFLGELGGLIGDLLFNAEGKKTGDSLFDSMADAVAKFRDYIADGKIEKWFKDSKKFAEDLGDALVGIGKVLDTLDSPGFRKFAIFLIDSFSRFAKTIDSVIKPISNFADGLSKIFKGDFSGAFDTLLSNFDDLGLAIANLLTGGFGQEFIDKFQEIGGDIIHGITQGISDAAGEVVSYIGSIPRRLIEAFTRPLGIASPSTVFAGFGADIIRGLIQGIAALIGAPVTLITGMASRIAGAFRGPLASAFDFVKNKAGSLGNMLKGPLVSAANSAKDKATSLGNYLKGGLSSAANTAKSKASALGTTLKGSVSTAAGTLRDKVSSLAGNLSGKLVDAIATAKEKIPGLKSALAGIGSVIGSLASKLGDLIGKLKDIPGLVGKAGKYIPKGGIATGGIVDAFGLHRVKKMAAGGFANFAQNYQIGEAGREAIVPLDRPLGQIDPAVRLLSAFAQGKLGSTSSSNVRTIDASGWTIQSPNDSETVAKEALDALVAKIL